MLVVLGPALRLRAAVRRRDDPTESATLPTLFDVNTEGNVPSWFAASLWMVAALLCVVCAVAAVRSRRSWVLLAALCLLLSLDEGAGLHEQVLGRIGNAVVGSDRVALLHFSWVVPGAVVVLVIVGVSARLIFSLPAEQRRAVITAGAIFVVGALVMESISGAALTWYGDGAAYVAATSAEEGLEMLAVILFVSALVSLLRLQRVDGRIVLGLRSAGRGPSDHRVTRAA